MNIQILTCEFLNALGANGPFIWQISCLILLVVLVLAATKSENSKSLMEKFRWMKCLQRDETFLTLAVIMLFVGNFPSFSRYECSADESEWMASAITLKQNPEFWLKYHFNWTRPLTVIPIYFLNLTGFEIGYGSIKVLQTLLMAFSGFILFKTIRIFSDSRTAKVCTLPFFALHTLMTHREMVAYNSEDIAATIIAVAVYVWYKILDEGPNSNRLLLVSLGILTSSTLLAKTQAIPIAGYVGLMGVIVVRSDLKKVFWICFGALLPIGAVLLLMYQNGVLDEFIYKYAGIIHYTNVSADGSSPGYDGKVIIGLRMMYKFHDTRFFFMGITMSFIILLWVILSCKMRYFKMGSVFSVLFFLISFICICIPGNAHYYYLNFLPFAFSILLGSHMAKICGFKGKRAPRYFLKTGPWVICVLTSLIPSLSLIGDGNEAFEHLDTNTYLGARVDPIPARIQEISKKQASLAIWGYLPRIHVECERSFGVRFPTPYYIVNNYPIKSKLLKSYAHDLNHNKPLFFLHAAGSKHQILGKAEHSYLNFPSISAIIQRDYSLLIESGKMQLFIRNKTHSRTY